MAKKEKSFECNITMGYITAIYIRSSLKARGTNGNAKNENDSLSNQRTLIHDYIVNSSDLRECEILEFCDSNHTGTVMERPALQEMLALAQRGDIHCIIVRDFSRLSRNASDSSYLIDQVFPLHRIRFISIGDNYDSNDYKGITGGINVSLKYVINDYYSKDISIKSKTAMRHKMAQGKHIVANAIYGYRKNDDVKWEPDPATAKVVQQIFQMALDGMATSQIRDKLHADMYPTPQEYMKMKRGKDITTECMWTTRMIFKMLCNEQYIGTYISGKQESKAVGSHSKINIDKSKWIIIPDNHPLLVSKEDFAKVQELIKYRKGSTTAKPLQNDMNRPKRSHMAKGKFIAATPIYGYTKMKCGKWEIDEPSGLVIQQIYEMAAQGLSYVEISAKLFKLEYPTPSEYIRRSKGRDITPTNYWTVGSVRSILKNEQYTGTYVSGKILKDYESGRKYHTPKNEWIVIPNKHPAIISKETFNKVQGSMADRKIRQKNMHFRDYLFRGLIACGCCGYALMYDSQSKVYRCHHTFADPNAKCHKLRVNAYELDKAVLAMIKKQAEAVLNDGRLSKMMSIGEIKQSRFEYKSQISMTQKQMKDFYEKYKCGEHEEEQFSALMKEYTKKAEELQNCISDLDKVECDRIARKKASEIAEEVIDESTAPHQIIEKLIDRVHVFPENQIKVDWKVDDFSALE